MITIITIVMKVIIIKIINEQQLTTTLNHEPGTFFSVMVVLPLTFSYFSFFLRRRSYPWSFHLSVLWSSPGGEELLVVTVPDQWTTTVILFNNNTEPWTVFSVMVVLPLTFFILIFWEEGLTLLRFICQSSGLHQVEKNSWLLQCHKIGKKSGTMSMSFCFCSVMVVLPLTFFHIFILSILWSSPGGKDLLVFTRGGQGVPKNHRTMLGDSFSGTAAGCIVSVGDVGLNAHHVWLKNPCFLVYFSINLVVLSPWLCAINSVDPISSLDFYGPMLWFTAAGWIVSVGDAGRM